MKKNAIIFGLTTALLIIIMVSVVYFANITLSGSIQAGILGGTILSGVYASCQVYYHKGIDNTNKAIFFNGLRTTAIIALLLVGFGVLMLQLFPSIKQQQLTGYKESLILSITENTNQQFKQDSILAKGDTAVITQSKLTLQKQEGIELSTVEDKVMSYQKKFTTMFVGINMMLIVFTGLVGSLLASYFLGRKK